MQIYVNFVRSDSKKNMVGIGMHKYKLLLGDGTWNRTLADCTPRYIVYMYAGYLYIDFHNLA